jgi:hypothetical protein
MTREERLVFVGDIMVDELKKIDMLPSLVALWEAAKQW